MDLASKKKYMDEGYNIFALLVPHSGMSDHGQGLYIIPSIIQICIVSKGEEGEGDRKRSRPSFILSPNHALTSLLRQE